MVAVSGGADSLSLLHLLLTLRDEFDLTLHVATFDHQIRGEAGAADVRFVKEIAAAWNVPCTAGSADVPELARQQRLGLEEAARQARYTFLAEVAATIGARQIATGHNQDDQAETVLMHAIRGAGLAGLRGMLPRAPLSAHPELVLVRPLLDTPRSANDAYLHDLKIEPRSDATNVDRTYLRNRFRHEILPLLETINPQVRAALARTAAIAQEDYATLDSLLPPLTILDQGLSIEHSTFLQLSASQQRMLIRKAVAQLSAGKQASFERVQAAIDLAVNGSSTQHVELIGTVWLGINGSNVVICVRAPHPQYTLTDWPRLNPGTQITIEQPGVYFLSDGWRLRVERSAEKPFSVRNDGPLSALLAIDPGAKIALRTRQNGDRFKPFGMKGHSRKFKEILIDMKVPVGLRNCVPLIIVNNEIVWFIAPTTPSLSSRISEEVAVRPDETRTIWRFTFARASDTVPFS